MIITVSPEQKEALRELLESDEPLGKLIEVSPPRYASIGYKSRDAVFADELPTQHVNCRCNVATQQPTLTLRVSVDTSALNERLRSLKNYFGGKSMCEACRSLFGPITPYGSEPSVLNLLFGSPSTPSPKLSEKEMIESIEAHLRRGNGLDDLTKLLTDSKAKRDAEIAEKAEKQRQADEAEKQRKAKLAEDKAKLSGLLADVAKTAGSHVAARRFVLAYAHADSTRVSTVEGVEYSNGSVDLEDNDDFNEFYADSLEGLVATFDEDIAFHVRYLDYNE